MILRWMRFSLLGLGLFLCVPSTHGAAAAGMEEDFFLKEKESVNSKVLKVQKELFQVIVNQDWPEEDAAQKEVWLGIGEFNYLAYGAQQAQTAWVTLLETIYGAIPDKVSHDFTHGYVLMHRISVSIKKLLKNPTLLEKSDIPEIEEIFNSLRNLRDKVLRIPYPLAVEAGPLVDEDEEEFGEALDHLVQAQAQALELEGLPIAVEAGPPLFWNVLPVNVVQNSASGG